VRRGLCMHEGSRQTSVRARTAAGRIPERSCFSPRRAPVNRSRTSAPCRGTCLRETGRARRISASEASGGLPAFALAARSTLPGSEKRRRLPASKGSDFWNHSLRGRPRSREFGIPNRNRAPRRSLEGSVAEPEVGEGDQHRRIEIALRQAPDGSEHTQSERRQELFQ